MKNETIPEQPLTSQEEDFCNLYVLGGVQYAGKHCTCYKDVFFTDDRTTATSSRKLLSQPHIQAHIRQLMETLQTETETLAVKLQVTETLKAVMEETATSSFQDKFGIDLSPAPLRAVSVNAAKALMDLYPIKHSQETKLRIEGEGSVVFNVIIPPETPGKEDET